MTEEERQANDLLEAENDELMEYISEMLMMISSGEENADLANIELVADNILAKSVQVHSEFKKSLQASLKELDKEMRKCDAADAAKMDIMLKQKVRLIELLS